MQKGVYGGLKLMLQLKTEMDSVLRQGEMCSFTFEGKVVEVCNLTSFDVCLEMFDEDSMIITIQNSTDGLAVQKIFDLSNNDEELSIVVADEIPDKVDRCLKKDSVYIGISIQKEAIRFSSRLIHISNPSGKVRG